MTSKTLLTVTLFLSAVVFGNRTLANQSDLSQEVLDEITLTRDIVSDLIRNLGDFTTAQGIGLDIRDFEVKSAEFQNSLQPALEEYEGQIKGILSEIDVWVKRYRLILSQSDRYSDKQLDSLLEGIRGQIANKRGWWKRDYNNAIRKLYSLIGSFVIQYQVSFECHSFGLVERTQGRDYYNQAQIEIIFKPLGVWGDGSVVREYQDFHLRIGYLKEGGLGYNIERCQKKVRDAYYDRYSWGDYHKFNERNELDIMVEKSPIHNKIDLRYYRSKTDDALKSRELQKVRVGCWSRSCRHLSTAIYEQFFDTVSTQIDRGLEINFTPSLNRCREDDFSRKHQKNCSPNFFTLKIPPREIDGTLLKSHFEMERASDVNLPYDMREFDDIIHGKLVDRGIRYTLMALAIEWNEEEIFEKLYSLPDFNPNMYGSSTEGNIGLVELAYHSSNSYYFDRFFNHDELKLDHKDSRGWTLIHTLLDDLRIDQLRTALKRSTSACSVAAPQVGKPWNLLQRKKGEIDKPTYKELVKLFKRYNCHRM
jgi:hypothetical protein